MLVAELAQRLEEGLRRRAHAALALHRLDQDARGVRPDRLFHRFEIAMRHLVETVHRRAKAFEIFGGAGGGERAQRAAMERALEGDDAIALGMALGEVIAAHDLDHAFHRFRAGIAEEHQVGKALLAQPRGELLAIRALEQVRHVPELGRLLLQRRDQMRMAVAQRIHRDARGEVEIALAIGGDQPAPSPRSKPRSTLAKTGSRCDVALLVMAITEGLRRFQTGRGARVHWRERGNSRSCENETCRLLRAARERYSMWAAERCQHATKPPFLHCKMSEIRRIAVWWKTRSAMHRCRNMWTHGRGLLRRSHAIL